MSSQGTNSSLGISSGVGSSTAIHNEDCNNIRDDPIGPDPNRWFFDKERLESTPSRKCGIDPDKELTYRQQSANFIQDMGQRLQVNQLCINTAIVYMHRFYMYHSFTNFHRNPVSTASIFLAAKVEEQPRKLEHVIKVANYCLNRENHSIDTKSEAYAEQASDLVITENILLQTLGFDVAIDHPHAHVVKCCQLVRASKDLAQTSYFMATNSLHLTTMCLQYKPTVVACVCIHLTCKWSNWEIPRSKEGRDWFWYVDETVTMDLLKKLTTEFLAIIDKSPSRLKRKILSLNQTGGSGSSVALSSYPTLNYDPNSPGTSSLPGNRGSSPLPPSVLGKRPLPPSKPSGALPVNPKSAKVNGNVAHPPLKHPSQNSSGSSAGKAPHYTSGSKPVPPGPPHSAKEPHPQQSKASGHHPSSGHPHSQYSSGRPSSQPHSSGHHSQNHGSVQPPLKPQVPSSSSHSGHPHPKSQSHPPSKSQYNYNMKPPQQPAAPSLKPATVPSSSSISSINSKSSQPSPYPQAHQVKKPYPEQLKRELGPNSDYSLQVKRELIDDSIRRPAHPATLPRPKHSEKEISGSSSSGAPGSGSSGALPLMSLTFNAPTSTGKAWDSIPSAGFTEAPKPMPSRPSSLFSPDPGLPETPTITPIQNLIKVDLLSPIHDGAKTEVTESSSGASASIFSFEFDEVKSPVNIPEPPPPRQESKEVVGTLGGPESLTEAANLLSSASFGTGHGISAAFQTTSSAVISSSTVKNTGVFQNLGAMSNYNSSDGEPPAKKHKKNKKEKHKNKDKDRDRHEEKKDKRDKEEKKHKDKSKEEKKHKSDKHKKDKSKEKERDKYGNAKHHSGGDEVGWARDGDPLSNKLKISYGSKIGSMPSPEKLKSKHSSKKHASSDKPGSSSGGMNTSDISLISTGNATSSGSTGIKLKIKAPRPPGYK